MCIEINESAFKQWFATSFTLTLSHWVSQKLADAKFVGKWNQMIFYHDHNGYIAIVILLIKVTESCKEYINVTLRNGDYM